VVSTVLDLRSITNIDLRYTILDEADEMLNEDWSEQLNKIMIGGSEYPPSSVNTRQLRILTTDSLSLLSLTSLYITLTYVTDINQDWDRRFLMFSATFPKKSLEMARTFMEENYVHLSVGRAGSTHKNVTQDIYWVDDNKKRDALKDMFFQHVIPGNSRVIIFVNYIGRVEELDDYLYNDLGLPTTFMHGKRSQYERDDAM